MDRAISNTIKRKRQWSRLGTLLLIVGALFAAIWLLRSSLQNSVPRNRIRLAEAELGPIDNTFTASGEVLPAFEQVITSPIHAVIEEVLQSVGDELSPGTSILQLDKSFSELELKKLQQELELKQNGIYKLKLELEKNFFDLQITDSTKALRIDQLHAELDNAKRLLQVGGGTQEAVDLAQLNLKIAQLEKRQLENDLSIQKKQTETRLKELKIQSDIQLNDLLIMEEKLRRAAIVASRPGILTWVNENIGTTVQEGETLARIADLGSYKVMGSCSDVFASRIYVGMRVLIQVNSNERTEGQISNIRPTVENNIIRFDIQLDEPNHPALRPNMKVEVFIVTASKPKVVRVPNGPAFKGTTKQDIFVVQDDVAFRRTVKVGLSNFDHVEIMEHLKPGEVIIISDMERYAGLQEIKIK